MTYTESWSECEGFSGSGLAAAGRGKRVFAGRFAVAAALPGHPAAATPVTAASHSRATGRNIAHTVLTIHIFDTNTTETATYYYFRYSRHSR